jgi:Fe-S cluster biogenesis protein NfuA
MKDNTLVQEIEEALNLIRPFLEADGGNVSLVEITDDYVAKVKLHGSCSSCSMSHMTMKAGIEETIKKTSHKIKAVVAVE